MGIKKLFGRRPTFNRAAERYDCRLPTRMQLCDSGVVFDGEVRNISVGGAMFRPALAYLLARKGAVLIYIGGREIEGEIMATTPHGYGLRFEQPLDQRFLADLLAMEGSYQAA